MGTTAPRVLKTTLPAHAYTDHEWFAREMEFVFAPMWLLAGRAEALAAPAAFCAEMSPAPAY